jgi:hypothetical protein
MAYLENYNKAKLNSIDLQKAYIAERVLDTQIEFSKEEFELVCEIAELCWKEFNLDPYYTTEIIQEIFEFGHNWFYEKLAILEFLNDYENAKYYIVDNEECDFDYIFDDEIPQF